MENKNQDTGVTYSSGAQTAPTLGVAEDPLSDPQALSLDPSNTQAVTGVTQQTEKKPSFLVRLVKRADVILAVLLVLGSAGLIASVRFNSDDSPKDDTAASKFETVEIPLSEFVDDQGLDFGAQSVTINGALQLNNGLVVAPSLQPSSAKAGQIYFDQTSNQLAYYNGTEFIPVVRGDGGVLSIGALSGDVTLGGGLSATAGQLSNSGVLSVQGQTGNVTLTAGRGIAVTGTAITNTGVVSVTSSSSAIVVSDDGNGNVILSGSGTGTVSSPGGTAGAIPLFTGSQTIEDSIITQTGLTVTITGDLSVVTGGLSLSNALTVSNGGTGTNSLAANGVLVGNGTSAITSVTAGGAGLCLLSTAGAPSWQACPGGGGVSSLNGLTGALNIANASGAGNTVTIDDATTSSKGIASFNATNFSVTSGAVNTIQNINSGATPTFAGVNTNSITPSSTLTVGSTGQQLVLQGNASTQLTATGSGFTTTVGFSGTPSGAVAYNFDRAAAAGTYNICTTAGNCVGTGGSVSTSGGTTNRIAKFTGASVVNDSTITDDGTTVSTTVDLVVQGGEVTVGVSSSQTGSITLAHNGSANTGTIVQGALLGNRTYTLPDANGTFCLTSGNCSGSGSSNTLQASYDAGNSITTTDARDVDIVLANTATDSNFDLVVADGSTGFASFSRANGAGTSDPAQMVLVDNLDLDRAIPVGIRLQAASGGLTTAIDASDAEIGDALSVGANNIVGTTGNIDFSNFDVVGSNGNVTAGGNLNLSGGGQYQVSGVQISSANLSNDANLAKLNASQTFTGNTNAFQNGTNSTNAFNVQNALGTRVLTIDTTNGQAILGLGSTLDGRLVFNNVSNANTVTIEPGTPSAPRTLTLPDASGIICTDSGNCAGAGATLQTAYNFSVGGTTPKIKVTSGLGAVDIQDADTTIGTDLLVVRASNGSGLGTAMFSVGNTGAATFQNSSNSTSALRLLTQGGTAILTGDTTNGQILLGQSNTLAGTVVFRNATNTNTVTLTTAVATGPQTITLPDATGTVCLTSGNCSGSGSSNTLQAAYDAGNSIISSNARDVDIVLANTTTDANFDISVATASTGFVSISRADGVGASDPSQLLLVDNLDVDRAQPVGLRLQAASGGLTTAIDASDIEIGTALNFGANDIDGTNFDVSGATGNVTTAGNVSIAGNLAVTTLGTADTATYLCRNTTNQLATCNTTGTGASFVQGGNSFGTTGILGTNDANALVLETGGTTRLTLAADGSNVTFESNMDLLLQGATAYISNPMGQTDSEGFGLNVTMNGLRAVALGNGATAGGNESVVIGQSASACLNSVVVGYNAEVINCGSGGIAIGHSVSTNPGSVAIGESSGTGVNGISIGSSANGSGTSVAIGLNADAGARSVAIGDTGTTGTDSVALGHRATASNNQSIAIGRSATTTASNQLVIGGSTANTGHITQAYIGSGVTDATPQNVVLQATGGSGSNIAGASFTLAGGRGTGTGNGGSLNFQIADPGTTGSSLNALSTVFSLSGVNGAALFQNSTDSASALSLQNSAGTETLFSVDTTARSGSGGNLIKVGNSTGTDTALTVLQLDATTADPTSNLAALNGGLFYNSTTHKVSLVENGVVKIICNTTDLGCGTGTVTLQSAYGNGNTITTTDNRDISFNLADTATDSNFLVNLQCVTACSTNGRFAVQDEGVDIFTISPASSVTVGNGIGATAVSVQCGTGVCGFGNNAVAHTTTVGSVTGAATTTLQGGTGGVNVGTGGIANTIQIGNITGAVTQVINMGNNATASSVSNVTIGSLLGASTTTIQAGTGDINLTTNAASATIIAKSSTNSNEAFKVVNSSNVSLFNVKTNGTLGTDMGVYVTGTGTDGAGGRLFFGTDLLHGVYIGEAGTTNTDRMLLFGDAGFEFGAGDPSNAPVLDISVNGKAVFQAGDSSFGGVQFLEDDGYQIFNADTDANTIQMGNYFPDSEAFVMILDNASGSDPGGSSAVNGAMYYNTDTQTFRCYENSGWTDCISRHKIVLGSNVADSAGNACTMANITGLSFSITSGTDYRFHANLVYTAAATTTGSRFSVNGPSTPTVLSFTTRSGLTTTTESVDYANAYDGGTCTASSPSTASTGNTATIEGTIRPSANGTFQLRLGTEVDTSAITVLAGSTLEWW